LIRISLLELQKSSKATFQVVYMFLIANLMIDNQKTIISFLEQKECKDIACLELEKQVITALAATLS